MPFLQRFRPITSVQRDQRQEAQIRIGQRFLELLQQPSLLDHHHRHNHHPADNGEIRRGINENRRAILQLKPSVYHSGLLLSSVRTVH